MPRLDASARSAASSLDDASAAAHGGTASAVAARLDRAPARAVQAQFVFDYAWANAAHGAGIEFDGGFVSPSPVLV